MEAQQKRWGKRVEGNAGLSLTLVRAQRCSSGKCHFVCCSGCSLVVGFWIVLSNMRFWHGKITKSDFRAESGLTVKAYLVQGPLTA